MQVDISAGWKTFDNNLLSLFPPCLSVFSFSTLIADDAAANGVSWVVVQVVNDRVIAAVWMNICRGGLQDVSGRENWGSKKKGYLRVSIIAGTNS